MKIRALREVFPDARFIMMLRHPAESIPSLVDLMSWYWRGFGSPPELVAEAAAALGEANVDGFSLDWRTDWRETRAWYPNHVLQGNLDPGLLMAGEQPVRAAVKRLIATMRESNEGRRCILNLGHGIHKDTPPDTVAALCDEVASHG